jgi:hypothetical protein
MLRHPEGKPRTVHDVLVSLTTTSRRIGAIDAVVRSLLEQDTPAPVVLWLSREPYLLDEGVPEDAIPPALGALEGPRLAIRYVRNIGPYRKLLPARRIHGGTIVTADDDTLYPRDWLSRLLALHARYPAAVCALRAHRMRGDADGELLPYLRWPAWDGNEPGHDCFPTGKDGVLYPPGALDPRVDDEQALLALAPTNDDIWFKAAARAAGIRAVAPSNHQTLPTNGIVAGLGGLFLHHNLARNDETLRRVFAHFGLRVAAQG